MNKKTLTQITIVSFIAGLMIAVQFNTIQNPTARDTRDIWEIRQELSEEKKRHSELLTEIETISKFAKSYENDDTESQALLLKNTVEELKKQVGLMEVSGSGITLNIKPAPELIQFGYEIEPVSPELIVRLINEIYRNNGLYIEIAGQRLTHISAIRDINGVTTINGVPIDEVDIEIKVITDTYEKAEKLYAYLYASPFRDDFYLDNLNLIINEAIRTVKISEFDGELINHYLVEN